MAENYPFPFGFMYSRDPNSTGRVMPIPRRWHLPRCTPWLSAPAPVSVVPNQGKSRAGGECDLRMTGAHALTRRLTSKVGSVIY
jgi:hypothetical protein